VRYSRSARPRNMQMKAVMAIPAADGSPTSIAMKRKLFARRRGDAVSTGVMNGAKVTASVRRFLAVGWACEEPLNLSGWKGGQRDIGNGRRVALLLPQRGRETKKERRNGNARTLNAAAAAEE
jgi:hypothetical protein